MAEVKTKGWNGAGYILVFLAACLVSVGYFVTAMWEISQDERVERNMLIGMANAFTRTYSEARLDGGTIPATFRRLGIEAYNETAHNLEAVRSTSVTMRMPGVPGKELGTVETNPDVSGVIASLGEGATRSFVEQFTLEQGRVIARTIAPSVATVESCVTCHNEVLSAPIYSVGDVMGAFVVETDLTTQTLRKLGYAAGAFALTLCGGVLILRRERLRMGEVVTALEGQVKTEKRRREAEAHASFLAMHDALTGLPNRAMFIEKMDEIVASTRKGRDAVIALIDLDDFKDVNDTLGHDGGDALLQAVGQRLGQLSRDLDGVAARLGGDEFALALPCDVSTQTAREFGDIILGTLGEDVVFEDFTIPPSVSVGLCNIQELAADENAMKAADMALYTAKLDGKNGFRVFNDEIRETMGRRAEMAGDLRAAIEADEIRLALQPQVDLSSGEIYGFEALARWSWNGHEVPPREFVAVAEEAGVIRQLDLAILSKAARFAAREGQRTGRQFSIASNISALDFADPELSDTVLDILFQTGLSPDRLTLEVTETVVIDDPASVLPALERLRAAGIKTALDDFGTGYSSLSYLTKVPFDTIKIDRSFVVELENDWRNMILLSKIIELGTEMGKMTVIEGIETPEQEAIAKLKGAHIGQGFYYARPLEESVATALLDEQDEKPLGHSDGKSAKQRGAAG